MKTKHTVRIAPSPTGKLHIGTVRTAYFNWLIAKQNPENKFIVRIDDTDLKRSQPELIQPVFETLSELGLDYDLTFKQSERFNTYRQIANKFVQQGFAIEDEGCIRLNSEQLKHISCDWKDEITGIKKSNPQIDDYAKNQVIIKSDGSPAYNFASTVDDWQYKITWIVRGVDHISNTYKQSLIFRLLGKKCLPLFSHVGLVCHKTGKKLSKRDSDELDLEGISTEAMLNYILRLGWSPKKDDKSNNIIDVDKAIKLFLEEGKMKSNNAKIDLDKLNWYNKKYKSYE